MHGRHFGPPGNRGYGIEPAVDQPIMKCVLEGADRIRLAESALVGLVLGEQPGRVALRLPLHFREVGVLDADARFARLRQARLGHARPPRPGIARPQLRQQPKRRRCGSAVGGGDEHHDAVQVRFGEFDLDIEVAVVVEDARVEQLVFAIVQAAAGVFLDKLRVGEGGLRVFIEHAHVGMAGHAIEIVVELLDVFAVVALGVGQAEQTFLQDRVAAVPHRQGQAQQLPVVGEPGDPVLAPSVRAAARVIVGQVVPEFAIRAVVFAHGPPLALAQVWTPAAPVRARVGDALAFLRCVDGLVFFVKCRH